MPRSIYIPLYYVCGYLFGALVVSLWNHDGSHAVSLAISFAVSILLAYRLETTWPKREDEAG